MKIVVILRKKDKTDIGMQHMKVFMEVVNVLFLELRWWLHTCSTYNNSLNIYLFCAVLLFLFCDQTMKFLIERFSLLLDGYLSAQTLNNIVIEC